MSRSKEIAGRRAAEFVTSGMTVGLGTGSTVHFTLERLAERVRQDGLEMRGVPTSSDTEDKARAMGIPMVSLEEIDELDLTIDGADEIDHDFQMIKGGGGALLREKIVALRSRREVIVVGREKLVERLGRNFLLPVETVPFARSSVVSALAALGAKTSLRLAAAGETYLTDNGNEILDCRFADGIADVPAMERAIKLIHGVVECGLFVDLADAVVIGAEDGSVEVREKAS